VTFPLKHLDMTPYLEGHIGPQPQQPATQSHFYNLVANIRHHGTPDNYNFNIHVHHKSSDKWYDVQDLFVEEAMPPLIALSEAYIQIYERADTITPTVEEFSTVNNQ